MRVKRRFVTRCVLLLVPSILPASVFASGHGPIFGFATPTLGKGAWSLDVAAMDRIAGSEQAVMLRSMLGYGITEDLQVSVYYLCLSTTRLAFPRSARWP